MSKYFDDDEHRICTKDSPFIEGATPRGTKWQHPDAEEIDEDYGPGGGVADGDYIKYRCPHCGKTFWEELPN